MTCRLTKDRPTAHLVWNNTDGTDFWRYTGPWARRARPFDPRPGARPNELRSFDSLIYLWIGFNAWLGQVVSDAELATSDRQLVRIARWDEQLTRRFSSLLDADGPEAQVFLSFRELWPVFQARALMDQDILPWRASESRRSYVAHSFKAGIRGSLCSPGCFEAHQERGVGPAQWDSQRVPLDWSHTLDAIYRVRCNLFHGGKSFRGGGDLEFVWRAHNILWFVWALAVVPEKFREPRRPR